VADVHVPVTPKGSGELRSRHELTNLRFDTTKLGGHVCSINIVEDGARGDRVNFSHVACVAIGNGGRELEISTWGETQNPWEDRCLGRAILLL